MNYFYYNVETIFKFVYRKSNGGLITIKFNAHHTVSDKCYNEDDYKKKIYLYGVDHAFEIANDKNYELISVIIDNQKIWLECLKDKEVI